jgi:hypothetical protein
VLVAQFRLSVKRKVKKWSTESGEESSNEGSPKT